MCVCACGVCGACGCCGAVLVARTRLEGSGLVSSPWSLGHYAVLYLRCLCQPAPKVKTGRE